MGLVELSRRVNDGQVDEAIRVIDDALGGLDGQTVLVLGLTYRDGVKELAYSRALPLIERLRAAGASVSAYDPLLDDAEVERLGATPWRWGDPSPARALVTQTADRRFGTLDATWFPELRVVYDGRNSLRDLRLPAGVAYHGVGVPSAAR
jgi:UDP-N-acetyl-D-mannosaminuronate dehydrogenase